VKLRPFFRARAFATLASLTLSLAAVPGAVASKGAKQTGSCPAQAKAALPLSAHATSKAAHAALAAALALYKELNVKGARVVWSKVASAAGPRDSEVVFQCGKAIQARTVVVELRFPKEFPSASLSEGVLFVSRFKSGYRVWERSH
jgi:hypothetical protein